MFGSKKIYTKVTGENLVVRVGGGYQKFEDFINTYAESERLRLEQMSQTDIDNLHAKNQDKMYLNSVPLSKQTRAGSPKVNAKQSSPRGSFIGK